MKVKLKQNKSKLLGAVCVLIIASLIGGFGITQASALNYMKDVNVQFTFNDAIRVSVSDPNLVINDLSPGTASDSNIITVNVLSNNPYGYTLTSNVGNNTTFNTDELRHTTSATATPFSTITAGTTVSDLSGFTNNQWGYSYSLDGGTTWINDSGNTGYSGLPLYSAGEATLNEKNTTSAAAGDNIEFKIAAKAASSQLSGEYQNIINFIATGAPAPPSCQSTISGTMQDFNPCDDIAVGTTGTLTDSRDTQTYTVAKLADNKYWMVENLNLAGGTALSSADTNVTDAYINSFTTSNNLTKNGNTIVLPASSTSGFDTDNYSYVYNSGNKTNCGASGQDTPCYSYYSWDAATLGSGRTISTDNTDAQQSICPKNWRLPTSRSASATNWQTTSDFYAMAHQYGLDSTTSNSESDADFYNNAGPGTTPNFLLAGHYYYGSFYDGGSYGYYWSSTAYSTTNYTRALTFNSTNVYSASGSYPILGNSVRCLFSS